MIQITHIVKYLRKAIIVTGRATQTTAMMEYLLTQGAFVELTKTYGCYIPIQTRAEIEAETQRKMQRQARQQADQADKRARKEEREAEKYAMEQAKAEGRLDEYKTQKDAERLANASRFELFVWKSKYLFSWYGLIILWALALYLHHWYVYLLLAIVTLCRWARPVQLMKRKKNTAPEEHKH